MITSADFIEILSTKVKSISVFYLCEMNKLYSVAGVLATAIALSTFATQSAFATGSDGACWGAATASFTPLGEHSSDPDGDGTHGDGFQNDQHREGLGNLKNLFDDAWLGLLVFLGFSC